MRAPATGGNGIELAVEKGDIRHAHRVACGIATDCGGKAGRYGGTVSMLIEFGDSCRIAVLIGTDWTRDLGTLASRTCIRAAKSRFGDVQISVRPKLQASWT